MRNKLLFDDRRITPIQVLYKIQYAFDGLLKEVTAIGPRQAVLCTSTQTGLGVFLWSF
jgi:hypothetical protein